MPDDLIPASLRQASIGDGSFPAGTMLAVPSGDGAPGEVAVESLAPGDKVLTLNGPVAVRHVASTRLEPTAGGPDSPVRARVIPVLVAAGAFGEGQPAVALLLPAEQLVHVMDAVVPQGALVPLGALVNGGTIRREPAAAPMTWVRLELERPGVVIAAGLLVAARHDPTAPPAAAILPAGPTTVALRNRLAGVAMPIEVAVVERAAEAAVVERTAEAVGTESVAEAAVTELAAEAVVTGPVVTPVVAEPAAVVDQAAPEAVGVALRVLVNGQAVPPLESSDDSIWHFMLPEGAVLARLVSPRGLSANTTAEQRATARRFGVAVRQLVLDDVVMPLDGPAIGEGFHAVESAGGSSWRWTAGEGVLHLPASPARRRLTVRITDWHRLLLAE